MAKFPVRVEFDEKTTAKLIKLFKRAEKQIVSEISTATDFGAFNRRVILAQIEAILTNLGVDVNVFLQEELPEYYKDGADDAVKQLKAGGAEVAVERGFNLLHQEAITALIDDTARAFGQSFTSANNSVRRIINEAVQEEITFTLAEGTISGKSLRKIKRNVKGVLEEEGINALVDRAGRKWSLDRYSEMLIRTKGVEARNTGLANRLAENGYDLVQVSSHGADDEECAPWEGEILSLTGNTKGYPTLAEAEATGLFHPNCKHAINALVPELAALTKAYDPNEKTKVVSAKEAREVSGVKQKNVKT
jgi:hypothetical protein